MEAAEFNIVDSKLNQLFLNPTLPENLKVRCMALMESHPSSHPIIWIMSSGTSSSSTQNYKLIGLSRDALLASAKGVNQHLEVTEADRWLNVLPLFHVGGLGILYRSYLSSTECINGWSSSYRWNPLEFLKDCQEHQITLSSLVPTQIFDLVQTGERAPSTLRAIVVGGARLNDDLYQKARSLGWPLLPSFGMTEACSQIATANLKSLGQFPHSQPSLQLLPHLKAMTNESQRLLISGASLMDGYYHLTDAAAPTWEPGKNSGDWYLTQDCAEIIGHTLSILARVDDVIKVRGENVNLANLRNRLESLRSQQFFLHDCTIIALPDARTGFKITLVGEPDFSILDGIAQIFNASVLPFERIERVIANTKLPRTTLGKLSHAKLTEKVMHLPDTKQ